MWYLSQEADKSKKPPSLDMYTLKDVADLLFMDHPVSLDVQDSGPSAFTVGDFIKYLILLICLLQDSKKYLP